MRTVNELTHHSPAVWRLILNFTTQLILSFFISRVNPGLTVTEKHITKKTRCYSYCGACQININVSNEYFCSQSHGFDMIYEMYIPFLINIMFE
jgi:hypothetical protein